MRRQVPPNLSERALAVWKSERRRTNSVSRQTLLLECLKHLDAADRLADQLAVEGLVVVTPATGARHLNPVAVVEREHRALFVRLARMLELQWTTGLYGPPMSNGR